MADSNLCTRSAFPKDLTGIRFGKYMVLRIGSRSKTGKIRWLCRCDCGNERLVHRSNLVSRLNGCGCGNAELQRKLHTTHGMYGSPEYVSWYNMIQRCENESNIGFEFYGDRGISVCGRWRASFADFFSDMGTRPEGTQIDRIDNNAGYTCGKCDECLENGWKSNCRWADRVTQQNNKRNNVLLTVYGKTLSSAQWSRISGTGRSTIQNRKKIGWSDKECVFGRPTGRQAMKAFGHRIQMDAMKQGIQLDAAKAQAAQQLAQTEASARIAMAQRSMLPPKPGR